MSKYKIAGVIIDINTKYSFSTKLMRDYEYVGDEEPAFTINTTEEMIEYEKKFSEEFSDAYCETVAVLRCVCMEILKNYDGFFFHCSSLEIDGKGFLFTAPSGTGKSTHTRLWREYFGDKVTMINDDKPIIKRENGEFFIYGTPWQGKDNIGNNVRVPISAICVLRQGKENKIEKITPIKALALLMDQTERPKDKKSMENLLSLLDGLLSKTPVYIMDCTISQEAVIIAYKAMTSQNI